MQHLLDSFEALSEVEQQQAAAELLRRALDGMPAELPEAALVEAAEALSSSWMPARPPMPKHAPGEVWLVDLGLAAKIRPCRC